MRKAVAAAGVMVLLLALYAAAGTWLAPRVLRDTLADQAQRHGLALRIGAIRIDPFALRLVLEDIEITGANAARLATARHVSADVAWSSLWGARWVVQRASVEQPEVALERSTDGGLHWPAMKDGARSSGGQGPAFIVHDISIRDGTVLVDDRARSAPVALKLVALALDVRNLSSGAGEPAAYALSGQLSDGGTLASQGSFSMTPLAARGRLEAVVPLEKVWQLAAPGTAGARGQLGASAEFSYEQGRVVLDQLSIEGSDVRYGDGDRRVAVKAVQLAVPRVVLPSGERFDVRASAQVQGGGRLTAQGRLAVQPLSADLKVEVDGLPLAQAQPWLSASLPVTIVSGTLGANGRVRVQPSQVSYEGALNVKALRVDERGSGDLLLAWQDLETHSVRFSPGRLEADDVVVRAPRGRLVIERDGRVNFAQAFAGGKDRREGAPLRASVRRLRVEDGTLDFTDRSLDNAFAVTVRELRGTVTGFSTGAGDPAQLRLAGRVGNYGSARIRGTLDLDAPKSLADIRATFRNLDLAAFTPYFAKFAGYRVQSGRLTAELRYEVRDARLVGRNELTIERMQLGEKVDSPSALDLPLELAVAVLADAEGRINLDIPVRGNLNDPQFDFGGLVAKALGNVIGRIASAPFRALGALLGRKGDKLDAVHFAAGSDRLAPPQEEEVAMLAKALAERPRLELAVQGGYDPQADAAALRVRSVRRDIARRAGYEDSRNLDFGDPKILHAAENLYLKRVGNRLELQELRGASKSYGRALIEKLAATVGVDEAEAQALAQARAETVRKALLGHGVAAERVRLEPATPADAGDEGVPTRLALDTRGG